MGEGKVADMCLLFRGGYHVFVASLTDAAVEQDPLPLQIFMSGLDYAATSQNFRNARPIEHRG